MQCPYPKKMKKKTDFFDLFELKPSFSIDTTYLENQFLKKQSKNRQDQNALSHLNKAYSTLLDPLERAFYILKIQNVSLDSISLDVNKLEEIIEQNDSVQTTNDKANLIKKLQECKKTHSKIVQNMQMHFDKKDMLNFCKNTIELSYLKRTISNIKNRITNFIT